MPLQITQAQQGGIGKARHSKNCAAVPFWAEETKDRLEEAVSVFAICLGCDRSDLAAAIRHKANASEA